MKRTAFLVCACLFLGATSSFAQDRSKEDTQTPNAAANPAADGSTQGNSMGNTTQNKNAMQSGHQGVDGAQMSRKQCQDLTTQEAKNPNMQRDPAKDKACAQILSRSGSSSSATTTQ